MKKHILIITMVLLLVVGVSSLVSNVPTASAQESYEVVGWRTTIEFNPGDEERLSLYTEFDRSPWLMDGKLYFWTLAEQKAIFKERKYDDVDVSVDISTINPSGKFDSGIYVHANNVGGRLDQVDGWVVNLEKGAGQSSYYLKLHRFENGRYRGCFVEVSGLRLPLNNVNLRVVVKSGVLFAFVDHQATPVFNYTIGSQSGYVGLRNFYSPNYFDNLSIVGTGNKKDVSSDVVIEDAKKIDSGKLTAESEKTLNNAIDAAEKADNQYSLEKAIAALEKAMKDALVKRTAEDLATAIEQAEKITDGSVYTENSWNSLQSVLAICRNVNTADEEAVSYWTYRLELKILLLVEYGG